MKVSFSLKSSRPPVATTAAETTATPPSLRRPAAFGSADDDAIDAAPTLSAGNKKTNGANVTANKQLLAQNVGTSKTMKKRIEAEMKVDATVYEYDEVWDRMQEAKQRQKEAKEAEAAERKPKYIKGLLETAETRRLDWLRAEEKLMQRERELEGDEFKDKEVFVTQAYKDQMEEVRKAEEEERRREEARKKGSVSTGMTHFYRKLLDESEQNHEAAVVATQQKRVLGPQAGPNLTITKPVDTPISDLELARIARDQGKEVELNDDNQIVDKRELLSAGLNLAAPNTRKLGLFRSANMQHATEAVKTHTAVGTAATRKEIHDRRMREVQRQMEDEKERLVQERQEAEEAAVRRIVAKRNTEAEVSSARERYLARKRQKLEDAAAMEDIMYHNS